MSPFYARAQKCWYLVRRLADADFHGVLAPPAPQLARRLRAWPGTCTTARAATLAGCRNGAMCSSRSSRATRRWRSLGTPAVPSGIIAPLRRGQSHGFRGSRCAVRRVPADAAATCGPPGANVRTLPPLSMSGGRSSVVAAAVFCRSTVGTTVVARCLGTRTRR